MVAAVCTVVAYQGAVAQEEQICIGVEKGAAGVAAEAVDVPSVASWTVLACVRGGYELGSVGRSRAGRAGQGGHTEFECFSFFEDLEGVCEQAGERNKSLLGAARVHTSPHPLQGYTTSSSIGDSG